MAKGKGKAAAEALKGPFKKYMDKLLAILKKPKKKGRVTQWEVGRYGDLKSRPGRDGMDMDHIPSKAALLKRAEEMKGSPLTPDEIKKISNSGTAIAVPRDVHHSTSRTYGARNTPDQVATDAADLSAAAKRDFDAYREKLSAANYTSEEIEQIYRTIQDRNKELGY